MQQIKFAGRKQIISFLILTCLISITPVQETHAMRPGLVADIAIDTTKAIGIAYLFLLTHIVAHKLGHSVMSKAFTGNEIDMSFGATPEEANDKKPIISSKHLKIYSLNPIKLLNAFAKIKPAETDFKNFLIYTGGGIFGAVQTYLSLLALSCYNKKSFSDGFESSLSPFENIELDIKLKNYQRWLMALVTGTTLINAETSTLYSFLPSNISSISISPKISPYADGTRAWEVYKTSKKAQEAIGAISWFAKWALLFWITIKAVKSSGLTDNMREHFVD